MAFLSLSLYDTPGLAPRMNVLFWEPGDYWYPISCSNRDTSGMLDIVIQEVLWSIRGPYSAICSLPLTNVKWYSDTWSVTVTLLPIKPSINFMILIQSLTFTELRVVSMDHLQRVWHASRERLPFRIPGSAPFWTCSCSNRSDHVSRTISRVFSGFFALKTSRDFLDFAQ